MQITVNEEHNFDLSQNDKSPDIIKNFDGTYHMILNNKGYNVKPLEIDLHEKQLWIEINGKEMHLKIQDEFDTLIKDLGFSLNVVQKVKEIKAPMPGLVLDIMVSPGDIVEVGTPLLILEAMKMENVIKSPGEGTVKEVNVTKNSAIEKGSLMIEME